MLPAIIDIEASGFGRESYPIEVGIVTPNGDTHCFIIKPPDHWNYWDAQAESVHGIKREMLLEKGLAPEQVAGELNRLLRRTTIYTDAWSYDISWLGKLFEVTGIPQLFSLESLRYLMSEEQVARWHGEKNRVVAEMGLIRHRASSDALILQETFRRTLINQLNRS